MTSSERHDRLKSIASYAEVINAHYSDTGVVDPVVAIEDDEELTWSQGPYGDQFDGLIRYTGKRFHIFLNTDRCERIKGGRGTFTLAHELGHFFIDSHNQWLRGHPDWMHVSHIDDSAADTIPYEEDANVFASSFLMPERPFRSQARQHPMGGESIPALADHFGVSLAAAARRCAELEVWPFAVICWNPDGTRRWSRCSGKVFSEYGTPVTSLDGVLAASRTAQFLRGEAEPGKALATAESWFPRVQHMQHRKGFPIERLLVQIDEHVVSQGSFGALTLLCGNAWYALKQQDRQR